MSKFICLQHTYEGVEAALFKNRDLIKKVFESKKRSSKYFIAMIQSLLDDSDISLDQLSFIAANKGPGPFTTLRVVLSSVNGLALAMNKPILGIDGLEAILQEYRNTKYPITVALLDAYSQDVYFGIEQEGAPKREKGYKNITVFLEDLKKVAPDKQIEFIQFIGNGSEKYQEDIVNIFGDRAVFDDPMPQTCSIEQVGKMAFDKWKKQIDLTDQLLPIYLKSMKTT